MGRSSDGIRQLRGEFLAELNAPLIERIDVPKDALHVYLVLVKRNQLA